jgi:RecA/RadA recombinase
MEAAVAQHHAAVVVVDSIAALMRAEFGAKGQVVERQELLGSQASVLKHLAESFRLPVVVTNQVWSAARCRGPVVVMLAAAWCVCCHPITAAAG